ncbi:hypothetical protein D3C77_616090 [compost metagenome]
MIDPYLSALQQQVVDRLERLPIAYGLQVMLVEIGLYLHTLLGQFMHRLVQHLLGAQPHAGQITAVARQHPPV